MDFREQAKATILGAIVRTTPKLIWERLTQQLPWAYSEAFQSTKHNALILPPYARFRAAHERHFLVEYCLHEIAREAGAHFAPESVQDNGWRYGILRVGDIALTQKCTPSAQGRPPAAEFRRRLAETGGFVRQDSFEFMGTSAKVAGAPLTAVLVHAPESRDFDAPGFSKTAFINLAVPCADYLDWAASLSVAEILAAYTPMQVQHKDNRPQWKIDRKEGGKEGA